MSIKPIDTPLDGERVIGLSPETANAAATDWLRRPNLFPGRALTAPTLEQRQRWQAGRIATRGQAFTSGVIRGLEVSFTIEAVPDGAPVVRLHVTPGRALTISGEDVVVAVPVDVRLGDLPVVAEPAVFAEAGGEAPPAPPAPGGLGVLRPRVIGTATLSSLVSTRADIVPPVGVLVLQPVIADRSDFDPTDPCDRCHCADATEASPDSFEDWRTADGVRLLWYAWPDEWRALPPDTPRRRNALAHVVFDAEAPLENGESLPWEPWGAPVALIGVDGAWQPAFVDRASVVRQGGRARNARLTHAADRRLAAGSRLQGLWQARIEQLAEQMAEMGNPLPDAPTLAQALTRLPPAGLLPINVINLDVLPLNVGSEVVQSGFFPPGFELDAVPVPLPQLDVAIREAAPLAAIDFSATERVRVLVPVTQASYEPRLLFEESVAPEFQQTVERFELERARALGARQGLRHIVATTNHAVDVSVPIPPLADPADLGTPLRFLLEDDPLALEPESLAPWGPPPFGLGGHRTRRAAGTHEHYLEGATTPLTAGENERLFAWVYLDPDDPPQTLMLQWHARGSWDHRAFWGPDLIRTGLAGAQSPRTQIDTQVPPAGRWIRLMLDAAPLGLADVPIDGMAFTVYDGRAAFGPSGVIRADGENTWASNLLPEGAVPRGDYEWEFLSYADLWAPFELSLGVAAPSNAAVPSGGGHEALAPTGAGQHSFVNATAGLPVLSGDSVYVWVWLDPDNPPRAFLLEWHTAGRFQHGVTAGEAGLINVVGTSNAPTRHLGGLPPLGTWFRLAVAAADVGLEGQTASGMRFTIHEGHAVFGATGRIGRDRSDTVWFAGALPAGAVPTGTWSFVPPSRMPDPENVRTVVTALADLRDDPALQPLSGRERSQLDRRGVAGFIAYLKARADRADDLVDYGFIKVQTDVYRVRQLVLGTTAATRLAVSPALATIAQAETAVASQEQISTFYDKLVAAPSFAAISPQRVVGGGTSGGSAPVAFEIGAAPPTRSTTARSTGARTISSARTVTGTTPFAAGAPLGTIGSGAGSAIQFEADFGVQPPRGTLEATFTIQDAGAVRDLTQDTGVIGIRATASAPTDVIFAQPIVGKANIRTTAIAQRLQDPKAIEAKDYTAATRHEAVAALVRLAEELREEDGGVTPALFEGIDVYGVRDDPFLGPDNTSRRRALTAFIADRTLVTQLLTTPVRTRPVPDAEDTLPDEGAYFSDSADLSDNTVALMRQFEGRIKLYRDAIAAAERTRAALIAAAARGNARLAAVADALAEARHDVSVAKALLAEESERIAAINDRRARVIAEEVRFLAFMRPREADNLATAPRRQVDPGLIGAPAPACLAEHADVPDDLTDILRVVREAPAAWLADVPRLVDRLDRTDLLIRTLRSAQVRTALFAPATATSVAAAGVTGAIASVKSRQLQTVTQARAPVMQLDLPRLQALTWQLAREHATQVVSLGDLIDGEHGRGDVARRAAQTFDDIGRMAACLHAEFSGVLPSIRLDWAETLSQFDEAPSLRRLGALARWGEIPYADRHRLQAFADWLFSRVNAAEPRAEALMNDVVRMCLLLASHAPIGRIVAGRLPRPMTVRPGVRLPLVAFDAARLRVGMEALVYRDSTLVARAIVEDIGTEVATRVVHTTQPQVDLDVNVRVQFGAAATLSRTAAARAMIPVR